MIDGSPKMTACSLGLQEPWYVESARLDETKREVRIFVGVRKDADGNAVERYAYDKAGNMLKKTLRIGRGDSPSRPQYQTTTFTFDDANQLVSSTTDGVTTRYTYDAAGRLVREGSKTYRYGYLDKVLSVTDGDTTRTYTYHVDGQLASASCDGIGRAGAHAALSPLRGSLRSGDMRTPQTETFLWDGLALIQRGDEEFVNEPLSRLCIPRA